MMKFQADGENDLEQGVSASPVSILCGQSISLTDNFPPTPIPLMGWLSGTTYLATSPWATGSIEWNKIPWISKKWQWFKNKR